MPTTQKYEQQSARLAQNAANKAAQDAWGATPEFPEPEAAPAPVPEEKIAVPPPPAPKAKTTAKKK